MTREIELMVGELYVFQNLPDIIVYINNDDCKKLRREKIRREKEGLEPLNWSKWNGEVIEILKIFPYSKCVCLKLVEKGYVIGQFSDQSRYFRLLDKSPIEGVEDLTDHWE